MKISDSGHIENILEEYNDFRECILQEVAWEDQGTTLELTFDYVERQDGEVLLDLQRDSITMRLFLVQEFHVRNALNDAILREPYRINWGLSEVALVELKEDEKFLAYYENPVVPLHHLAILWETERRIDIVFSGIEME